MLPSDLFEKRILLSPLNWGMGHVSRCIPLIKKLKSQNNVIFIACSDRQRKVFESYVDEAIVFIDHEEYPFEFKGRGEFISDTIINLKNLKKRHVSELTQVSNLVDKFGIDVIVSDHRYGFRSEKCISIFMTHQLHLPLPWYFRLAQFWHRKQILKFDFQWIVDAEIERLAGKLSNREGFPNSHFIGIQSRFNTELIVEKDKQNGILLISGPKEYVPNLIETFRKELFTGEINLIIGNDEAEKLVNSFKLNQPFYNSNDWKKTDLVISSAKKIYSYCGYSTLMDLYYLNCQSKLIACPGQLEQIYLQKKS
jgi:hypothetical protein